MTLEADTLGTSIVVATVLCSLLVYLCFEYSDSWTETTLLVSVVGVVRTAVFAGIPGSFPVVMGQMLLEKERWRGVARICAANER